MEPIFIGRVKELGQLDNWLNQALQGTRRLCLIAGDRGDGKTTLVEHFAEQAQQKYPRLTYARGTCDQNTMLGKGYEPIHDVFAQLTGVRAKELQSALRNEREFDLKHKIQIAAESLAATAPDLIGVFVPGVSLLSKVASVAASQTIKRRIEASEDPDIRMERIQELCINFFTDLTVNRKSPLILVFDDIQWMDDLSFNLLCFLQDHLPQMPALIIATYRPNEVGPKIRKWVDSLRQDLGEIVIDLGIKTSESENQNDKGIEFVREFLERNYCEIEEEKDFVNRFYARTTANPLFCVELLHLLKSASVLIETTSGTWKVNNEIQDWTQLLASGKLEALIDSRLAALDKDLKKMLQIASIQGPEFLAQTIAHLIGKSEREVLHTLYDVLGAQYGLVEGLYEESLGSTVLSHFRFTNIMYQERIYASMGLGVRRTWHSDVALTLEQLYGEKREQLAVHLARHYELALNYQKAAAYLIKVGSQQATEKQRDAAIKTFKSALAFARSAKSVPEIIDCLKYLGTQCLDLDETEAESYLTEGLNLAERHQALEALSYLLRAYGRLSVRKGKNSEAVYYYMESLNVAKQIPDKAQEGACLNNIGDLASTEERYDDAEYYFKRRLKIAEDMDNASGKWISLLNLGMVNRKRGLLKEARDYLNKGFEVIAQRQDWHQECGLKVESAYVYSLEKDFPKASQEILDVLKTINEKRSNARLRESLICSAGIMAGAGSWPVAGQAIGYIRNSKEPKPVEKQEIRRIIKSIPKDLSAEDFNAAMQVGSGLSEGDLLGIVEKELHAICEGKLKHST